MSGSDLEIFNKASVLVETMADVELKYGSGYYNQQDWHQAYQELKSMLGYGEEWEGTVLGSCQAEFAEINKRLDVIEELMREEGATVWCIGDRLKPPR